MRPALVLSTCVALLAVAGSGALQSPPARSAGGARVEAVVTLAAPPLAYDPEGAARVAAEQRSFEGALTTRMPGARVRWRYRLVANGLAVTLPASQVDALRGLPGVRAVSTSTSYGPALDRSPGQIGARALWGTALDTAGQGVKIGIIDSGIDQRHPFFAPAGYALPDGFPKGQRSFTTAKVIVARAFAPPGSSLPFARAPFDPRYSGHGTHVAGIAAGNAGTQASGGRTVSGVAPKAYLGNYKVFSRTPSGITPNANAPEIVAAIEAAVADGMDVINLSLGEPELEPSRDVVALALDGAAAAGVVPVVAAGNGYNDAGAGSVDSPANSARAISVAAVEIPGGPATAVHADFSSVGPTPVSLRLKPDVAAPGIAILSSVPDGWSSISGTSMASPHVAGAAALLVERHPAWTVADVKSALVQTGVGAARSDRDGVPAGPQFVGGGVVALTNADQPLLFAAPTAVSLQLLARGAVTRGVVRLRDAGGGAGAWDVSVARIVSAGGAEIAVPSQVEVPGELGYEVAVPAGAAQGDVTGYLELRRGTDLRRIPLWGRVTASSLARQRTQPLERVGAHRATTSGRPGFVVRYRYPESPGGLDVNTTLSGPELVFRVRVVRRVANFGVAITSRAEGSRVEPRVVFGLDENRLLGYAGLPTNGNPYLPDYHASVLAAGALSPRPGEYAVVFDSPTRAGAGAFRFRYWIDDVTPPSVRLVTRAVAPGQPIVARVTDAGSGVYPDSVSVVVDGLLADHRLARGAMRIPTSGLLPGRHRLRLVVSDYQETRNTENVARILPNTRTVTSVFTVRRPR